MNPTSNAYDRKPSHRRRMRRHVAGMLLIFLLLSGLFYFQSQLQPEGTALVQQAYAEATDITDATQMRVGISDDAMTALEYPSTQITATGPFTVTDQATGQAVLSGQAGEIITVTVDKNGFNLKSNQQAGAARQPVAGPLQVRTGASHRLKIMSITRRGVNPQYRGAFEIARGFSAPNKLTVINVVSLEDYLKAVVPNELPMKYGLEAVKAQSIAARNYAIRPREKPWKHFDICDSQYCQVYLGSQTETPGSNAAIAETAGLIGLYEGEPILALFSSSHGGYSEAYAFAFSDPKTKQYPAPPIPYLAGGADMDIGNLDLSTEAGARAFWTRPQPSYDVDSPYYRWKKQWTRPELEAAINKGLLEVSQDTATQDFVSPRFRPGDKIGTLKRLEVKQRGLSGKIMQLEIVASQGRWLVQKEFLVRKVLSHQGRMLPSANLVLSHLTDAQGNLVAVVGQGGGFGHGVGLSQLGASWMSHHGYGFADIIRHYYKGASLGSVPLTLNGSAKQPMQTRFVASQRKGRLLLETASANLLDRGKPVALKINGRTLSLTPQGSRSQFNVDAYLKTDGLNTLTLYPDPKAPDRTVKAWVELYPPQAAVASAR